MSKGYDFLEIAKDVVDTIAPLTKAEAVNYLRNVLSDVYRDGRVYGQRKVIDDLTHDIKHVLVEYEDYDGD
jgi:hypothetical protein